MSGSQEASPGDDFFNDLTQQASHRSDEDPNVRRGSNDDNEQLPKPKRIACVLCRKRKLRCDGNKPSCGTCTRLAHDCSYDEVRRKSGPKRGYVKLLEARLAQVETMLKTQDEPPTTQRKISQNHIPPLPTLPAAPDAANIAIGRTNVDFLDHLDEIRAQRGGNADPVPAIGNTIGGPDCLAGESLSWDMISLGLDEPLPTQDVIDELNDAFFEKIHPSMPVIHRPRYLAAMNLAPHMRPPVCLRYAMWAHAASLTEKYEALAEHFYLRARKYIQQDEMRGHGEGTITIAHCQTWCLVATYEFKLMFFPRAWMSAGRASRLGLMMGLHRLDAVGLDVKQCLPPAKDFTEKEERRRTFWALFCVDRYSSIGTGWPMVIEEDDIHSDLPVDEISYELNRAVPSMSLSKAFEMDGPSKLSSFSGVIVMASLFGRNLTHLHRPRPNDQDDNLNGEFWRRHRNMDNILSHVALQLPDRLRLPQSLSDPNVVFLNMNIHTSTICLHQAAIFKADQNKLPAMISTESKMRCIGSAGEIATIMRQISHLNLANMNPFISFCLYVAARVFVQYLKSRPKDGQIKASLQFLLSAMHAIKKKNPLTESFLVQLDVDLVGAGLEDIRSPRSTSSRMPPSCPSQQGSDDVRPTFGDNYLSTPPSAANSAANNITGPPTTYEPHCVVLPNQASNLSYPDVTGSSYIRPNGPQFELTNRQRSPGSSTNNCSPAVINQDMDTSPDGGGSVIDLSTPNSSTQSNNLPSSHSSYSPQNLHSQVPHNLHPAAAVQHNSNQGPNMFEASFADQYQMQNFASASTNGGQENFAMWSNASTGLTPGPMSNMPDGGAGMNGMINGLSDADWTQVLDSFGTWDNGINHEHNLQEMMGR